jgi:heme exporter protein A
LCKDELYRVRFPRDTTESRGFGQNGGRAGSRKECSGPNGAIAVPSMLSVTQLSCIRGERELFAGLSFALDKGGWLHVTGDNGAGKTSLLRMLCGLSPPAGGEIRWNGENIGKLGEMYREELVYLGHQTPLKDELSARENLQVSSILRGIGVTRDVAADALEKMGLAECADLPVRFLSQGQKRRIGLSSLLLDRARLWILDEPFAALDFAASGKLASLLAEHAASGGMTVLTGHQEVRIAAGSGQTLAIAA